MKMTDEVFTIINLEERGKALPQKNSIPTSHLNRHITKLCHMNYAAL